jgi:hypothetical protein
MAHADGVAEVAKAADSAFDKMPTVVVVDRIAGKCGADANVNRDVAYCTTGNQIFVARDAYDTPKAPYLVAHSYGHAAQVQHGVADFALGQIRNRRSDEAMLRGFVERQVDCIAGFFISQADLPAMDLNDLFTQDPLSDVHWGRNPLRIGPVVGVELAARAEWFAIGQGGDLAACAPGEFTAELLLDALRP